MKPGKKKTLEKNLLMFYYGNLREASEILFEQKKNMLNKREFEKVKEMVGLAEELKNCLKVGKIEEVGKIMHEGWTLKKKLATRITDYILDTYYDSAIKAGAIGGKLLGAGGGGFLLFYCEPEYQDSVRKAVGLRELRFRFESGGTRIIYADN